MSLETRKGPNPNGRSLSSYLEKELDTERSPIRIAYHGDTEGVWWWKASQVFGSSDQ